MAPGRATCSLGGSGCGGIQSVDFFLQSVDFLLEFLAPLFGGLLALPVAPSSRAGSFPDCPHCGRQFPWRRVRRLSVTQVGTSMFEDSYSARRTRPNAARATNSSSFARSTLNDLNSLSMVFFHLLPFMESVHMGMFVRYMPALFRLMPAPGAPDPIEQRCLHHLVNQTESRRPHGLDKVGHRIVVDPRQRLEQLEARYGMSLDLS